MNHNFLGHVHTWKQAVSTLRHHREIPNIHVRFLGRTCMRMQNLLLFMDWFKLIRINNINDIRTFIIIIHNV